MPAVTEGRAGPRGGIAMNGGEAGVLHGTARGTWLASVGVWYTAAALASTLGILSAVKAGPAGDERRPLKSTPRARRAPPTRREPDRARSTRSCSAHRAPAENRVLVGRTTGRWTAD